MIRGYEGCTSCKWKNIFWVELGEPQPLLIASLKVWGGFICPACRAETGTRMDIAPVPAGVILSAYELAETEEVMQFPDERAVHACPMTFRRHLRAFVRWCGPWDDETNESKAMLIVMAALYGSVIAAGWLLGSKLIVGGVTSLVLLVAGWLLAWRAMLTLVIVILALTGGDQARSDLKQQWRLKAEKPLFPEYRRLRADRRWLRSRGYSRKEARRSSRMLK